MKKTLLSLIFIAPMALASQMPNPILQFRSLGAAFGPGAGHSTTCQIFDRETITRAMRDGLAAAPHRRNTKWTSKVPNARVAAQLARQAKKGKLVPSPGPVGGRNNEWTAILTVGAGAPDPVLLQKQGREMLTNDSEAAEALMEVITVNCHQR